MTRSATPVAQKFYFEYRPFDDIFPRSPLKGLRHLRTTGAFGGSAHGASLHETVGVLLGEPESAIRLIQAGDDPYLTVQNEQGLHLSGLPHDTAQHWARFPLEKRVAGVASAVMFGTWVTPIDLLDAAEEVLQRDGSSVRLRANQALASVLIDSYQENLRAGGLDESSVSFLTSLAAGCSVAQFLRTRDTGLSSTPLRAVTQ